VVQGSDEAGDGLVEQVVAVTGDHVAGAWDARDLSMRDEVPQLADAFRTHHVAAVSVHEQGGHGDLPGCSGQAQVLGRLR
jgi:hypothetical protein